MQTSNKHCAQTKTAICYNLLSIMHLHKTVPIFKKSTLKFSISDIKIQKFAQGLGSLSLDRVSQAAGNSAPRPPAIFEQQSHLTPLNTYRCYVLGNKLIKL